MRQCVEVWGGRGSKGVGGVVGVPERYGCQPREKLWLTGLGVLPVRLATSGLGAASVSTHFHTWTNSKTGQEKQSTRSYLCPYPPSTFLPSKNAHHHLPTDLQSNFSPLIFKLFLCHLPTFFCPQLPVPCALQWFLKTLLVTLFVVVLSHYMVKTHCMCVCECIACLPLCVFYKNWETKKTKRLHSSFDGKKKYTALSNI